MSDLTAETQDLAAAAAAGRAAEAEMVTLRRAAAQAGATIKKLTEENAHLAGHQNARQKIQHLQVSMVGCW